MVLAFDEVRTERETAPFSDGDKDRGKKGIPSFSDRQNVFSFRNETSPGPRGWRKIWKNKGARALICRLNARKAACTSVDD